MNPDLVQLDSIHEILNILSLGKILGLFLSLLAMWFCNKVITSLSQKIEHRFSSKRLLVLQVATVLSFCVYIFGSIFIIYGVIRPPKELMIAIGGSAAVAIGLSLKDLVSSLVAGLILLFDRPFQVGDRVSFGETYGEIKSIGLRAVRLLTLDDNLVTIPNSKFVTDVVASGNAGSLDMMVCVSFYVSVNNDLQLLKETITEILYTSRYVYLKRTVAVVAKEMIAGELLVIELTAKAYVLDVKFEKAFQTDIVTRVEEAFNQLNIKRPNSNC